MNHPEFAQENLSGSSKRKLTVSNTEITVRPENRKEFFQTVSAVSGKIRNEKGCVSFRFYEETGNENSLFIVGEWESKEHWNRHRQGDNFAVLHGSVQVLSVRSKIDHKLLSVLED